MLDLILFFIFRADINNLASEKFQDRECAQKRLEKYDFLTWKLLDKKFDDLEQAHRAKRITDRILKLDNPPVISTLPFLWKPYNKLWNVGEVKYPYVYFYDGKLSYMQVTSWVFNQAPGDAIVDRETYIVNGDWLRDQTKKWYKIALKSGIPYFAVTKIVNLMKEKEKFWESKQ